MHFTVLIYPNNAIFKSTKFMKDSERLKNCHSLEENKKMWQLNTMWDLVLDPETQHKKDINGKNW